MKTKIIITLNLIVATFIFIYVLNYEEENNSLNKTINLIHETSCFKSSDKYYQIYNKENNLYELYDYNQNLINSSNNQITLYQDNIYSLDNKVYPEGEFLISKDLKRIKVADGIHKYSELMFIDKKSEEASTSLPRSSETLPRSINRLPGTALSVCQYFPQSAQSKKAYALHSKDVFSTASPG